jgi:single-strand DNA-binding protein
MLLGNLGQDPELRMTSGGRACLNIRMATTESYLDANRMRKEKTAWHSVVVWGKRAEGLAKILSKGSRIMIEGAIEYSEYDKKDGTKGYRTNIVARNVVLCGGGRNFPAGSGTPREEPGPDEQNLDDEIPF